MHCNDCHRETNDLVKHRATPLDEFSECGLNQLDDHHRFMERVNTYRAAHGITWGGPPFSEAEYAFARKS